MERYETVKDIGSGKFGVAKLLVDKCTRELFAVKFIERGTKIDELVKREIMNHRVLKHPSIIRFKEVLLTPTHLGIVMEYAAGGELFERICKRGRFPEDEARYFFQQLISGVGYCHSMQVCHRDLKLENTLLDGSTAPRVKICDFGYSKSSIFHSQPKSTVGTPAYIAPEVLVKKEYDGKMADIWSCGVTLYVMLFGAYPFQDPNNPKDVSKTMQQILHADFLMPNHVQLSMECRHLLSSIFVKCPEQRITISGIQNHPWFLKNLPMEMMEGGSYQRNDINYPSQNFEDILSILEEAKTKTAPSESSTDGKLPVEGSTDLDDMDDEDVDDAESSDEYVRPL